MLDENIQLSQLRMQKAKESLEVSKEEIERQFVQTAEFVSAVESYLNTVLQS